MPSTFQALFVLVVALLPGAIYTWAFERIAGRWGIGLSDRVYRFLGISAIFHVIIAPATYQIWRHHFHGQAAAESLPLWLWAVAVAYVAVPGALGTWVARAHGKDQAWARAVVGETAAPTAWDAVFSPPPTGSAVLLKLKSGTWIGGEFNDGSYVGGFPEPADIYIIKELLVDQTSGDFVRDSAGKEVPVGSYGILVRWDEVEYLEIGD